MDYNAAAAPYYEPYTPSRGTSARSGAVAGGLPSPDLILPSPDLSRHPLFDSRPYHSHPPLIHDSSNVDPFPRSAAVANARSHGLAANFPFAPPASMPSSTIVEPYHHEQPPLYPPFPRDEATPLPMEVVETAPKPIFTLPSSYTPQPPLAPLIAPVARAGTINLFKSAKHEAEESAPSAYVPPPQALRVSRSDCPTPLATWPVAMSASSSYLPSWNTPTASPFAPLLFEAEASYILRPSSALPADFSPDSATMNASHSIYQPLSTPTMATTSHPMRGREVGWESEPASSSDAPSDFSDSSNSFSGAKYDSMVKEESYSAEEGEEGGEEGEKRERRDSTLLYSRRFSSDASSCGDYSSSELYDHSEEFDHSLALPNISPAPATTTTNTIRLPVASFFSLPPRSPTKSLNKRTKRVYKKRGRQQGAKSTTLPPAVAKRISAGVAASAAHALRTKSGTAADALSERNTNAGPSEKNTKMPNQSPPTSSSLMPASHAPPLFPFLPPTDSSLSFAQAPKRNVAVKGPRVQGQSTTTKHFPLLDAKPPLAADNLPFPTLEGVTLDVQITRQSHHVMGVSRNSLRTGTGSKVLLTFQGPLSALRALYTWPCHYYSKQDDAHATSGNHSSPPAAKAGQPSSSATSSSSSTPTTTPAPSSRKIKSLGNITYYKARGRLASSLPSTDYPGYFEISAEMPQGTSDLRFTFTDGMGFFGSSSGPRVGTLLRWVSNQQLREANASTTFAAKERHNQQAVHLPPSSSASPASTSSLPASSSAASAALSPELPIAGDFVPITLAQLDENASWANQQGKLTLIARVFSTNSRVSNFGGRKKDLRLNVMVQQFRHGSSNTAPATRGKLADDSEFYSSPSALVPRTHESNENKTEKKHEWMIESGTTFVLHTQKGAHKKASVFKTMQTRMPSHPRRTTVASSNSASNQQNTNSTTSVTSNSSSSSESHAAGDTSKRKRRNSDRCANSDRFPNDRPNVTTFSRSAPIPEPDMVLYERGMTVTRLHDMQGERRNAEEEKSRSFSLPSLSSTTSQLPITTENNAKTTVNDDWRKNQAKMMEQVAIEDEETISSWHQMMRPIPIQPPTMDNTFASRQEQSRKGKESASDDESDDSVGEKGGKATRKSLTKKRKSTWPPPSPPSASVSPSLSHVTTSIIPSPSFSSLSTGIAKAKAEGYEFKRPFSSSPLHHRPNPSSPPEAEVRHVLRSHNHMRSISQPQSQRGSAMKKSPPKTIVSVPPRTPTPSSTSLPLSSSSSSPSISSINTLTHMASKEAQRWREEKERLNSLPRATSDATFFSFAAISDVNYRSMASKPTLDDLVPERGGKEDSFFHLHQDLTKVAQSTSYQNQWMTTFKSDESREVETSHSTAYVGQFSHSFPPAPAGPSSIAPSSASISNFSLTSQGNGFEPKENGENRLWVTGEESQMPRHSFASPSLPPSNPLSPPSSFIHPHSYPYQLKRSGEQSAAHHPSLASLLPFPLPPFDSSPDDIM